MAIDETMIRSFMGATLERRNLDQALRLAGFRISFIHQPNQNDPLSWGLKLKKSEQLKALFKGNKEVLCWVSEHQELQVRTITRIRELIRSDERLTDSFSILVSGDLEVDNQLPHLHSDPDLTIVPLPISQLLAYGRRGGRRLVSLLTRHVYARDLYAVSGALTNSESFYGRRNLLSELRDSLLSGEPVGIFGLRKMGKTSLLYRVLEGVRGRGALTGHVDLQRVLAVENSQSYFLWSLGQALFDGNSRVRKASSLRLIGRFQLYADIPLDRRRDVAELIDHDIRVLAGPANAKIVLFVDEIERMWPRPSEASSSPTAATFVGSWRLLRGLEQELRGKVAFYLTGTSPMCLESPRVGNEENPLHRGIPVRFLPHLGLEDRRLLIQELGSTMGIEWEDSGLSELFDLVAGHPSLLRGVGSIVHRGFPEREEPLRVDAELMKTIVPRAIRELHSAVDQMMAALQEDYRDDYMLLELLAQGRRAEFGEYASQFSDAVVHLQGYELVRGVDARPQIAFDMLHTWLQRKHAMSKPSTGPSRLPPGVELGGCEVVEKLSSGGYGEVYRATKGTTPVAVKVFHDASLESLNRETEVLSAISHPNIVKLLDHGRDVVSGRVFLTMELLEGEVLSRRCERSARLRRGEVLAYARKLLDALTVLHPDRERAEELRNAQSLSMTEYEDLQRASVGYVHRDIKPENIVLVHDRGPVLIDFGISSRVGTGNMTSSHTQHYLPSDFDPGSWSPDVDLYQLGLTLLQAWLGQRLSQELGADQLRDLAVSEIDSDPLLTVMLKLCAPSVQERFSSAREAIHALEQL